VKVLFDSNVHISDAIYGGAASRAVTATVEARWRIFVCDTILDEVFHVLRTKFNRSKGFAHATVQALRDMAEIADERESRHQVPGDPSDTPILHAAIGAGVDYLVTGDSKILAINRVEGVRIINLTDYLHMLQYHGLTRA
jgi:putative PIN family toxin of toxin-antitoxin system